MQNLQTMWNMRIIQNYLESVQSILNNPTQIIGVQTDFQMKDLTYITAHDTFLQIRNVQLVKGLGLIATEIKRR